jgi:hypothetical protein
LHPQDALYLSISFHLLTNRIILSLLRVTDSLSRLRAGCYLLQWIVYDVWPLARLSGSDLMALFAALLCLALLTAITILRPAKNLWMRQRRQPATTLLLPAATLLILVVVGVVWENLPRKSREPRKAFVHVAEDAVDVRLNWTSSDAHSGEGGVMIINPSILVTRDGKLVRAAREHARVHTTVSGTLWRPSVAVNVTDQTGQTRQVQAGEELSVTEEILEWKSSIVVAEAPLGAAAASVLEFAKELDGDGAPLRAANLTANLRTRAPWGGESAPLCQQKSVFSAGNNTLSTTKVLGAEDPKLFRNPVGLGEAYGEWALSFSSLPPAEHRPGCQDKGEAVKQMYVSVSASRQSASAPAAPVRIDCGFTRRDEKNWIAFWRGDQLHFVYSLYPHTVVLVRPSDGACVEKWSTSTFEPMKLLDRAASGLRLHGSATAER